MAIETTLNSLRSRLRATFRTSRVFEDPIYGTAILLVVFVVLNALIERLTHLPTSGFFSGVLVLAFLQNLGAAKILFVVAAVALLVVLGRPLASWSETGFGGSARGFVLIVVLAAAWPLLTAGHNYYFEQAYLLDKALLLATVPLIWWRPVFVFVFAGVAYLLLWTLAEPSLGGSILPHKLQLLRSVNVFAAAFLVFTFTGRNITRPLLIVLCSFVAAAYWLPALAKFDIAWLSENNLLLAPVSAYAHGWLAFLPAEDLASFARRLMPVNPALKVFVITIEALCLVFLFRRWLSIALLSALIIFHLGVFVMYGFLFWTWIVLDLALLGLILAVTREGVDALYNLRSFAVSVFLVALAAWWAKPPQLGWYDTPLSYTYRIVAEDASGKQSLVHPRYFAPYDDVFTMASFSYLVAGRSVLTGPYGVTHRHAVHTALAAARRPSEIFDLESTMDVSIYSPERTQRLNAFLRRFIENRQANGQAASLPSGLRAPPQFWSFRGEHPAGEITSVAVVEVTQWFDGERIQQIRNQEVLRIEAPFNGAR